MSTFLVSLSPLKVTADCSYCYTSAIAHQLAATTTQDVAVLAANLARKITADFASHAGSQDNFAAIATDLQVQPTQAGTLILTLSPQGLAEWLREWLQNPLPPINHPEHDGPETEIAHLVNRGRWPLSDRLQLSLPLLLQWAHSRCHVWQQQLLRERSPITLPQEYAGKAMLVPPIETTNLLSGQMNCALTYCLLPALMQALNRMAASAGTASVCLRQGYRLAEQVYHMESRMAQWHSKTPPKLATTLLAAMKKCLRAILSEVFHANPLPHL